MSFDAKSGMAVIALMALLWGGASPVHADVILGSDNWNDASQGLMGWQTLSGAGSVSRQGSGGNSGGWLQISFPEIDPFTPPGASWSTLVATSATNLFAGTWTRDMYVQFDFWSSNQAPTQLSVRWQSMTNSYVWSQSLNVNSLDTWSTLSASFSDWENWVLGPGASEDMFVSDLASINWIGIYAERTGPGAQDYGLDNFNLMVPEPGEYAMLGAALLATWVFVRRWGISRG